VGMAFEALFALLRAVVFLPARILGVSWSLNRSRVMSGWPNPSVERTHNGGARLFAPSRVAAPLCAAHVKR